MRRFGPRRRPRRGRARPARRKHVERCCRLGDHRRAAQRRLPRPGRSARARSGQQVGDKRPRLEVAPLIRVVLDRPGQAGLVADRSLLSPPPPGHRSRDDEDAELERAAVAANRDRSCHDSARSGWGSGGKPRPARSCRARLRTRRRLRARTGSPAPHGSPYGRLPTVEAAPDHRTGGPPRLVSRSVRVAVSHGSAAISIGRQARMAG